jgi:RNA polymerase sigma-70 factor (ECF subfamily)
MKDFQKALEYGPELLNVAFKWTRHYADAEDLVQDTVVKAFAAWDSFEEGTNVRAWLYCIMRNLWVERWRKAQKAHTAFGKSADVSYLPVYEAFGDTTYNAVQQLTDNQRAAVIKVDVEQRTYKEAAEQLNCPPGTVMIRVFRARNAMREKLREVAKEYGIIK